MVSDIFKSEFFYGLIERNYPAHIVRQPVVLIPQFTYFPLLNRYPPFASSFSSSETSFRRLEIDVFRMQIDTTRLTRGTVGSRWRRLLPVLLRILQSLPLAKFFDADDRIRARRRPVHRTDFRNRLDRVRDVCFRSCGGTGSHRRTQTGRCRVIGKCFVVRSVARWLCVT